MVKMTGAQALVEALKRQNVEVIFGIIGGAILPVHDTLRDSGIRHVLVDTNNAQPTQPTATPARVDVPESAWQRQVLERQT